MEKISIVETNFHFSSLTPRKSTEWIVLHHTGSVTDFDFSALDIHGWHRAQGWAGIGYHYVVRKSGIVERGRPLYAVGAHAYGENWHSVGIHLSGDFDSALPTDIQIDSTALLIANLCSMFNIPIDRSHILGHYEINATSCPGKNLIALLDTIIGKALWYAFGG